MSESVAFYGYGVRRVLHAKYMVKSGAMSDGGAITSNGTVMKNGAITGNGTMMNNGARMDNGAMSDGGAPYGCRVAGGSSTVKTLPLPGLLHTVILPPSRLRSSLLTASPRPEPP